MSVISQAPSHTVHHHSNSSALRAGPKKKAQSAQKASHRMISSDDHSRGKPIRGPDCHFCSVSHRLDENAWGLVGWEGIAAMTATWHLTKDRGLAMLALVSISGVGTLKLMGIGIREGVLTPELTKRTSCDEDRNQGESHLDDNHPVKRDSAREYGREPSKDLDHRLKSPSVIPGPFLRDFYDYYDSCLSKADTQPSFWFPLSFIYYFLVAAWFSMRKRYLCSRAFILVWLVETVSKEKYCSPRDQEFPDFTCDSDTTTKARRRKRKKKASNSMLANTTSHSPNRHSKLAQSPLALLLGSTESSSQDQTPPETSPYSRMNPHDRGFAGTDTDGELGSLIPIHMFKCEFKGTNVTSFLRLFENHIKGRVHTDEQKKLLIVYFSHEDVRSKVEKACVCDIWEETKTKLLEDFKEGDEEQQLQPLERILKMNTQSMRKASDTEILNWLKTHRELCEALQDGGKFKEGNSYPIFHTLPRKVIIRVCRWKNITVNEMQAKTYDDMVDLMISLLERDQSYKDLIEEPWEREFVSEERPSEKDMERSFQPPSQPKTDPAIESLAKLVQGLSINVTKRQENLEARLGAMIQNAMDKQKYFNQAHNNYIPAPKGPYMDDQDFIVNASYGQRQIKCFYCCVAGHFPNQCYELQQDRDAGYCDFDSEAGMAWVGRREADIPSKLVWKMGLLGGVKKLVVTWIRKFPKSPAAHFLDGMMSGSAIRNWTPNQEEQDLVTDFMKRNQNPMFEDLVIGKISGRTGQSINGQDDEPIAKANIILIDNDDAWEPPTILNNNVTFDTAISKRARVEELPEEAERDRPIPLTTTPRILQPTNPEDRKLVEAIAKDNSCGDTRLTTLIENRASLRQKVLSTKINVSIPQMIQYDPEFGRSMARELIHLADGVTDTVWLDPAPSYKKRLPGEVETNLVKGRKEPELAVRDVPPFADTYFDDLARHCGVLTVAIGQDKSPPTPQVNSLLAPGDYLVVEDKVTKKVSYGKGREGSDWKAPNEMMMRAFISLIKNIDSRPWSMCQDLPRLQVRLGHPDGHTWEAILDTGAEGNIISDHIVKTSRLPFKPSSAKTTSFSKDSVPMAGVVNTRVYLGNVFIEQQMYMAPASAVSIPFILGMPFFRSAKVTFDYSSIPGEMLMSCKLGTINLMSPVAGGIRRANPVADDEAPGRSL